MSTKGPQAGEEITAILEKPGDVVYLGAFIGSFAVHDQEEARRAAKAFTARAATGVYRIELVERFEKTEPA